MGSRHSVIRQEYPVIGTPIRRIVRNGVHLSIGGIIDRAAPLSRMIVNDVDIITDVCGSRYTIERTESGFMVSGWFGTSGILDA